MACLSAVTLPAARPVTLVQDGKPRLSIVVGSAPEPAAELQHYIEAMSDVRLPMSEEERRGVYVGLISDFPSLRIADTANLGVEGFLIRSDGEKLLLLANERPGVQHAVTTFLQSLGCRWFFPGDAWEVVPKRSTITGSWDQRSQPDFNVQRRIWYGFGAYSPCRKDYEAWMRHNRMGSSIPVSIGHTTHGLDPKKDFQEHPEWFALVDGKRQPSKPCYSHPAVAKHAVAFALKAARRGVPMISMSPPDGLGYCECERCFKVFQGGTPSREHRTVFAQRPDGVVVNVTSETLFRFINQITEALAKEHPDTLIGCYAYSAYSHPPSFKLLPNVFVQTTTAFRRTDLSLEEQLNAWSARTRQLGIRDYYSVYQWDWDLPPAGKMAPAALAKTLRYYHDKGVTSINAEASNNWAARGLGYYLAAQWMWDVDADRTELLRDFYEKAFGPAAKVMERYYVRWYGDSASASAPRNEREPARFNTETMKASFKDLDEAVNLLNELPKHRARVDELRAYWHYLLLRDRVEKLKGSEDREAIRNAIKEELIFAGRLAHMNIIHARPLLGKAFMRRFKGFETVLSNVPAVEKHGTGWRAIREPPTGDELDELWRADLESLGLRKKAARIRNGE